jgi:putative transposase
MTLLGCKSFVRKKQRHTKPKEVKVKNSKYPNVVARKWDIYRKGELFVTDVLYLPYGDHKYAYLSVLKDAKTGFITGWVVSKRNDNKIYINTLKMAEKHFDFNKKIIIHSDNGFQYTSLFSQKYCANNNIIISLSRAGNSIDNAMCETFFSSLKTEYLHKKKIRTFDEMHKLVSDYIDFYNYKRIMLKHKSSPWEVWCREE